VELDLMPVPRLAALRVAIDKLANGLLHLCRLCVAGRKGGFFARCS
jgi:hypothetical protein